MTLRLVGSMRVRTQWRQTAARTSESSMSATTTATDAAIEELEQGERLRATRVRAYEPIFGDSIIQA